MPTLYNAAIAYNSELGYNGDPSVVTATELPTWQLDVTNKAGVKSPLPEAMIDQMSFEMSTPSAISFSVAQGTVGETLCDDLSIVELRANGQRIKDGRWLLRGKGWNAGEVKKTKKYTGRHLLWDRLEHAVVVPGIPKKYAAKTPGFILNDLFADVKTRGVGYWSNFTWTFDVSKDSNGQAWPVILGAMEYLPGAKYSDIVANMVDKGVIDVSLLGDEIRITVAKSDGVVKPALLVVGKDLADAPQQSSADNLLSDVVVMGDNGTGMLRSDPATRARYWREEGSISQGGTSDVGTLSLFGDVALSGGGFPKVQRTYGLVVTQDRPFLPLRDYAVGDWVRAQHGDEPTASYRVMQIVLKQEKGQWTGSLVLNDKFLEAEIRLAKKVDGIIGGSTITGSAQTATPDDLKDKGIPAAMTGFNVVSNVYQNDEGITKAILTATWNPVTLNTDGTNATDMGTYYVVWWYNQFGFNSRTEIPVEHPGTTVSWSDMDTGRDISVYIYSKDKSGHQGSWNGAVISLRSGADTIAPPQPSVPEASSLMKLIIAEWNGLTAAGQPMPPDFSHLEVWASAVNNFDPLIEGKLRGTMKAAGQFYITDYENALGTFIYVRFIAVDNSGNRSIPSIYGGAFLQGVTGPDITANSIDTNNIKTGAITAQLINAGAITADKISLGQTTNLVPDPSFNNADWRAERKTTKWADKPSRWFFNNWSGATRNGYYLQALSTADGVNGGRMYMCDWISCQLGESYYAAFYMRNGEFFPNVEATMFLGVEVTLADGSVQSDGINYQPFTTWTKYGYRFLIQNKDWVKVRFFVRCDNINLGDIILDDMEVRGGVGTTEYAGSRGLLDALGLFSWDASENQTFLLDFRTGDFTAKGQIQSGFTGKRTVINPGFTYLPEIRFYPDTGNLYAYINASNVGTYPFIAVNAPDTGTSSQSMTLYEDGFQLGDLSKATTKITGAGIETAGIGGAASMWIYGKISSGYSGLEAIGTWRSNCGIAPAAQAWSVVMTKPPAALSGRWHLIYDLFRPGTAQKTGSHISTDTTTQTTISIYTLDSTNFTAVAMYVNHLWVRSDGDA